MTDLIVIAYGEQSQVYTVITAFHHLQSEGWNRDRRRCLHHYRQ